MSQSNKINIKKLGDDFFVENERDKKYKNIEDARNRAKDIKKWGFAPYEYIDITPKERAQLTILGFNRGPEGITTLDSLRANLLKPLTDDQKQEKIDKKSKKKIEQRKIDATNRYFDGNATPEDIDFLVKKGLLKDLNIQKSVLIALKTPEAKRTKQQKKYLFKWDPIQFSHYGDKKNTIEEQIEVIDKDIEKYEDLADIDKPRYEQYLNKINNLKDKKASLLQQQLNETSSSRFVVGGTYKDKNGNQAKYIGVGKDGKDIWEEID